MHGCILLEHQSGGARWVTGEEVVIAHDASKGGFGFALGALPADFDSSSLPAKLRLGNGFAGYFSMQHVYNVERSIQYAELFAIVASVAMYAPYLRNRALLVTTDNLADVHVINRQSTRAPDLLPLLRYLYATCAFHNIALRALHVPGVDNILADYLSRPNLHEGRRHVPHHVSARHTLVNFIHSSGLTPPTSGGRAMTPTTFTTY
jgi:hypothetical protein